MGAEMGVGPEVAAATAVAAQGSCRSRVRFPNGLPGFPDKTGFELEALAGCEGRFLLLRSLDDPELRLVVMPAPADQPIIAERHMRETCCGLGWSPENVLLLFVVTLAKSVSGLEAFVNLRAPIFFDRERALAIQVVLPDRSYPFRHPLERRQAG
jgi:flagellar assembly factor FliW